MNNIIEALYREKDEDAFIIYNHMELETLEPERAVFCLTVRSESKNSYGVVHGGVFFAMGDNAAGFAANSDGHQYVTQTSTMHFLKNQSEGTVRAEARVRQRGRSTCLVEVDILGNGGELLATGDFTFFRINRDNK